MGVMDTQLPIGQQVSSSGHLNLPVTLESARPLGKGFECRVRLHDGSLDEAIISEEEAAALAGTTRAAPKLRSPTPSTSASSSNPPASGSLTRTDHGNPLHKRWVR
jgi:hypothetical protein